MNRYEIRRTDGRHVENNILVRYFGNTWKSVLNRLNHNYDGYLMSIHDRYEEFKIYRILDSAE